MKDISAIKLLQLAWKHIWTIILAAVVFACSAFAYATYVVVPTYSTTTSIIFTNGGIVNNNYDTNTTLASQREYVSGSDISASDSLGQTIVDILKTPGIYKQLASKLGSEYSYSSLSGGFSIARREEGSLLLDITYTSTDGDEAIRIANKFADLSCDYVSDYIPYSKVKVVAEALSYRCVSMDAAKLSILSGLVGALLAYGVFFLLDLADKSIRGEDDYNANYTSPLLGVVPDFEEQKASYKYKKYGYKYGNYYSGSYKY